MKILVISNLFPPDFLGGYELGCRQAVDALRAAGHEVRVLAGAPRRAIPPGSEGPHVLRRLKLTDLYDDCTQMNTSLAMHKHRYVEAHGISAFNVQALCDVLEDFKPDVAYLWNLIGLGGLGLIAALQHTGTPWVMHLMDIVPLKLCELVPHAKLDAVQKAFLQLCRGRFISCSQTTLDEIADGGLPLANRATLIPNWVEKMDPLGDREYMADGTLKVVAASTLSRHKGTHILIEAAAILKERGVSEFSIDLFGHCSDPQFESMILANDVADRVRYRGVVKQADLIASYTKYDAFALPTSPREPFAFAPMEAATRGCVPMVSALSGYSEWFVDGVDCVKVNRDAHSWADAIEALIADREALAALGRRSANVIFRDYRLDVMLPRIVAILQKAMAENTAAPRSSQEACRMAILAERTFYCLLQELAA